MAGDDGDGAKFAHGARIDQNQAIQQRPFDIGQRDAPEDLPAIGAQQPRRFFFGGALLLHERNQLARHEGKGGKNRCQHNARYGKDDLHAVRFQPAAHPAVGAVHQHQRQAGNDGRNRKGQINQGEQNAFAAKVEFGDRPCRSHAKNGIERQGNGGYPYREPNGR